MSKAHQPHAQARRGATRPSRVALTCCLAASVALSGCVSARPRPYAPVLAPATDQALLEHDFTTCATDVAADTANFRGGRAPMVAAGVGGAAATSVLSGAATGATTVGAGAGLAATGVGIIVLIPVATYALSSARRKKNERAVQTAMNACLAERGHAVVGWKRLSGRQAAVVTLRSPTRAAR